MGAIWPPQHLKLKLKPMARRISSWVPSGGRRYPDGLNLHMLFQDVSNSVVPYRNSRKDIYRLVVSKEDLRWAFEESLGLDRQSRGAADFVRGIARQLFIEHVIWIELAVDPERPATRQGGYRNDRLFEVALVNGLVVDPISGKRRQILPRPDEIPQGYFVDYGGATEIDLSGADLFQVNLPPSYPADVLRDVVTQLARIPEKLTPEWVDEKLFGMNPGLPTFNVSEHIRLRDLLALQATNAIGWTARELFMGERRLLNDYAHFARELKFLHFRVSLRAEAEAALVAILSAVATELEIGIELFAEGLLTPAQVETAIERFRAGDMSFSEVNDWLFEKGAVEAMGPRRLL